MDWYLFELCYQNKDLTAGTNFHKELLANSSDAKARAIKVLQEAKEIVTLISLLFMANTKETGRK